MSQHSHNPMFVTVLRLYKAWQTNMWLGKM
jgi:hypothetical protein